MKPSIQPTSLGEEELRRQAESWSAADPDPETVEELRSLLEAREYSELRDRFSGRLEFGTAGLRGVLGAGPHRMNRAVVRTATAGLARYLKAECPQRLDRGVVIGRDARRMSLEFAEDAAAVFAAEGIPVSVFENPVPTPLLAFATHHLGSAAGVMITASHNPAEYNGYKVYWENGAQIIPPRDQEISECISQVGRADQVRLLASPSAGWQGLWSAVTDDVGDAYVKCLLAQRRHPDLTNQLRIVYTPMHGVGGAWVRRVIGSAGVPNLLVVPQQQEPDPTFPTVHFPNPEEPGALQLALELAQTAGADLVLANDPDADRLAVAARDERGTMRALSGDEVGALLGHYLLTQSRFAKRPLVISTIVSSWQLREIARALGAQYEQTLTGFKWIANRALELEARENLQFVFGYEEALGYSIGMNIRDKDGIGAALVVVEMAGWCAHQRQTLPEYLEQLQRQYGLFLSRQKSFTFSGLSGAELIRGIISGFRVNPPNQIAGLPVERINDYLVPSRDGSDGNLPPADVLSLEFLGGGRVTLRPSGTEPKIKYYFEVRELVRGQERLEAARQRATERLDRIEEAFIEAAKRRGQPG